MGFDGDHLLKRLQPVVRPCGPEFRPRGGRAPGDADFTQLIDMASRGELASGRPVSTPSGGALDRDRLDRLSTACDALESRGIERGAVLMDGRAFVLDVASRSVVRELSADDAGNVEELGGVIRVLGPDERDAEAGPPNGTPRTLRANPAVPPGVLAQLERGSADRGA
jgi:hypothetical protein